MINKVMMNINIAMLEIVCLSSYGLQQGVVL